MPRFTEIAQPSTKIPRHTKCVNAQRTDGRTVGHQERRMTGKPESLMPPPTTVGEHKKSCRLSHAGNVKLYDLQKLHTRLIFRSSATIHSRKVQQRFLHSFMTSGTTVCTNVHTHTRYSKFLHDTLNLLMSSSDGSLSSLS